MSLVGNLEDLSLGDILQIISLSQKSGVLALSGDNGTGRIVFRSGAVQAACLKGQPNDLRDLLVSREVVDGNRFDAALALAREREVTIEETLETELGLAVDRLESLIQQATEAAVLEMFTWPSGEFSFDVRGELEGDDPQLILASGLNAQYLAMEGLRLRDERVREEQSDSLNAGRSASQPERNDDRSEIEPIEPIERLGGEANAAGPVDPIFGDDPLEIDPPVLDSADLAETMLTEEAIGDELLEAAGLDELDLDETPAASQTESGMPAPASEREVAAPPPADPVGATRELVASVVERASPIDPAPDAPGAEVLSSAPMPTPVVLIEPDVSALEWVKSAIHDDFARVHTFQQADPGLARIRQYLIRGELPVVLLSPDTPIDPLSGIHGMTDFVRRLKTQAPRLVVLGLVESGEGAAPPGGFDDMLARPTRQQMAECSVEETGPGPMYAAFSRSLREILEGRVATGVPEKKKKEEPAPEEPASENLKALRNAIAQLQQATSRGEVLPVVLDFAATLFARAAILMVRDGSAFAIAGRGMAALEVDPLDSPPAISLDLGEPGWLHRVVETGRPVVAEPGTPADRALLEAFGGVVPQNVYLGPIETGDSGVALLYGDQGEGAEPMPDTSALEVVLHHAGLALDRATLARALWEAEAEVEVG